MWNRQPQPFGYIIHHAKLIKKIAKKTNIKPLQKKKKKISDWAQTAYRSFQNTSNILQLALRVYTDSDILLPKNTKHVERTALKKQVCTQWMQGTQPMPHHYDYKQQKRWNENNHASLKPSGKKSIHASKACTELSSLLTFSCPRLFESVVYY